MEGQGGRRGTRGRWPKKKLSSHTALSPKWSDIFLFRSIYMYAKFGLVHIWYSDPLKCFEPFWKLLFYTPAIPNAHRLYDNVSGSFVINVIKLYETKCQKVSSELLEYFYINKIATIRVVGRKIIIFTQPSRNSY
jgi:hypothetical protein